MADISEVLVQESITFNGVEYPFLPPDMDARAAYTRYLGKNAISFVRDNKDAWGEDYWTALDRVIRKGGAKAFNWGGETWKESMNVDECVQKLALLMLSRSNSRITKKLIEDLWDAPGGKVFNDQTGEEDDSTLGLELVQKMARLINRPNSPRPDAVPGEGTATLKSAPS